MSSFFYRVLLTGGIALLLVFAASPSLAQEVAPAPAPRDFSGPQTIQQQTPTSEGIHARGSWAITVSNPDGSEAREYRVENALALDGARVLAGLLSDEISGLGEWEIRLRSEEDPQGLCDTGEPECRFSATPSFVEIGGPSIFASVWTGDVQAEGAATIVRVGAGLAYTDVDGTPVSPSLFSRKDLDTPIPVAAGQFVSVRIEFTFS